MSAVGQTWSLGQERDRHCHPGGIYLDAACISMLSHPVPGTLAFLCVIEDKAGDLCNSLGKGGAQPGFVCSCTQVLSRPSLRLGISDALRSRK